MHSRRTGIACSAALALAIAGCGGGSGTSSSNVKTLTTQRGQGLHVIPLRPLVSESYNVVLKGFPKGSPTGSGLASVSVNAASKQLCWTVKQLTNVPNPTEVRLFQNFPGAEGTHGLHLGHGYVPSGCEVKTKQVLQGLERVPGNIYLSIHTREYPGGAVRGPL